MYEAHFGLADSPFHIAPDLRFYVEAAPHRAAMQALRAGLARGDEFMLLTGDFGAGKTIVARRLVEEFPRGHDRIGLLSGQCVEGDDLFGRVAEAFLIEEFEARHPLVALTRVLERYGHEGRKAFLLIDEAHRLDVHSLRRLRKLTGVRVEGHGVLHVALVGRHAPSGIAELAQIGRPLQVGAVAALGALDPAGTAEYVRRRLVRAGWSGRPSFEDDALAEIHVRCEGNPGRINRLCSHVLLQLYMKDRDAATVDFVRAIDELIASEMEDGDPEVAAAPAPATAPATATAWPGMDSMPAPAEPPDAVDSDLGESFDPLPTEPIAADMLDDAEPAVPVAAPVDLEILMVEPVEAKLPVVRHEMPVALPGWQGAPAVRRSRPWVLQGLAGLVLFVSGGLAWQALSDRVGPGLAPRGDATADRPPATSPGADGPAAGGYESAQRPAPAPAPAPGTLADSPGAAALDATAAQALLAGGPPSAGPGNAGALSSSPPTDAAPGLAPSATSVAGSVPAASEGATERATLRVSARQRAGAATRGASAAAAAACSVEANTLGLCNRVPSRAEGRAATLSPAEAPTTPAADSYSTPATRVAPPIHPPPTATASCDASRAALGLCPEG